MPILYHFHLYFIKVEGTILFLFHFYLINIEATRYLQGSNPSHPQPNDVYMKQYFGAETGL